jgi:putative transcriptional regulator
MKATAKKGKVKGKRQRPTSTAAGRGLVEAMGQAVALMRGDASAAGTVYPKPPRINVAAVRSKTGLSQIEFAKKFMLVPGTVRNWEQGIREPEGPARLLLAVIDQAADVVSRVADQLRSE